MNDMQELTKELAVLVEILSEFQQQNDNIRVRDFAIRLSLPTFYTRSLLQSRENSVKGF